ncbi:MAG: IclR family transcriptional regulator C-terminal domain-containing protein, partial [Marmoricola sp.]
AALGSDLAHARARGFAVTHDELEIGLSAVAAPVCGAKGAAVAAVGVSGPTARLEDRVDHVGRLLMEQAEALSALLRRGSRAVERETA